MFRKFVTSFITFIAIVSMLFVPLTSVSANSEIVLEDFPVNVAQTGWTPVGFTNVLGDAVWDGDHTVDGSSNPAKFIVHYEQINTAAHWGICPDGWETDPGNEALCRELVSIPATYHEAVTHEITVTDVEAWDETVVDAEGYWTTVVDVPSYIVHHDAITHVEHQTRMRTWVAGHWGAWGVWGTWTFGNCSSTGKVSCPAPEVQCQERTVTDKDAWDEDIPAVTHQEWVPPVTHIVSHPAITHQETVVDDPAYYSCDDGYALDGQVCNKYEYQKREWVTDTYSYMDQAYRISRYDEPKAFWLQMWTCSDSSLCFNHVVRPGPDAGCFIYDTTGDIIPTSQVYNYCDVDPAYTGGFTLAFAGWVRLLDKGTHQVWGAGGEGDVILAKINAENGWHLTYMWFFPGYAGH